MSERIGFKKYVTPQILALCWGVSLLVAALFVAGLVMQMTGLWLNPPWMMNSTLTFGDVVVRIIGVALVLLGIRIWLEFLSIVFSIHDRLLDLAEILEQRPSSQQPMPPSFPIGTRNPLYSTRK
jgi:ethanolamine transporter EutH